MKKLVKATLLLMAILTMIYASAVVYANTNSGHRDVVYGAFEYKSETPPSQWYMPEQLGIVKIIEYVENYTWLHVVVDRQKEPFPLQEEPPIFKYKDKFYRISELWVTRGLSESAKGQLITGGVLLASGWVFTGALFTKERKAR